MDHSGMGLMFPIHHGAKQRPKPSVGGLESYVREVAPRLALIRVNIALDAESKALLREEAAYHRLSLSARLRVIAQTLKLPAPADMPISVLRAQVHQLIEDERKRELRKRGH